MRISDWSSDVCSSDLLVHVGHAAVGVAREQIGAQKLILLVGRPRLAGGDDKVAVAAPVALLRLAGGEFAGAHAHRYAGRTIGAARPIGDRLDAAESDPTQRVVELVRIVARKSTSMNSSHQCE